MVDQPGEFNPELLSDNGYTPGIAAMTKITSQLLNLLKESHNFRYLFTSVNFCTYLRSLTWHASEAGLRAVAGPAV